MPRVLALDLSSHVGFAMDRPPGADDPTPLTGVRTLRGGIRNHGVAGVDFSIWLVDLLKVNEIDLLAYEAPVMSGVPISREVSGLLWGLAFLTETCAAARLVPCFESHVQTVRKDFLGTGRPKDPKKAVMARCAQLGWHAADDNAADAAALYFHTKLHRDPEFGVETGLPMFQREG